MSSATRPSDSSSTPTQHNTLNTVWAWLITPHQALVGGDARRARLTAILMTVFIPFLVVTLLVFPIAIDILSGNPIDPPSSIALFTVGIFVLGYAFCRSQWYLIGTASVITAPVLVISIAVLDDVATATPEPIVLPLMCFTIILGALLSGGLTTPTKDTLLATLGVGINILGLMWLVPEWQFSDIFIGLAFNTSVGALLAAEIAQREQAEKLVTQKIAELEQADKALREANSSLEKRVAERTQDLEIALREREEADRLKDEFMATMSHELRTPLNAIIGFSGIMLMMGDLDETKTDRMKRIRSNADRLLNLINDILDISRIESGRLETLPVDIHLSDFIERIKEQTQILADEKHLDVTIQKCEKMPEIVRLDEDLLTKIATNLISNAIKFTEEGSISVTIESIEDDKWRLTVADTGIGIPVHMHDTIFERFRQVDGTSKRAYGGSGLGLAIVKQMTEAMNGKIWVRSEVGEGSTFTVELPKTIQPTVKTQSGAVS
ncbi:MAG: HAMP domain-containing sensor histidine kinase [Chloroflexota bacterium]